MATTNLISKSLGDVLTESGNGSPNHTSPLGSLYTDKDTGKVWVNIGTTLWEVLSTVAYGEAYVQGNTTPTTISSATQWTASGINLTEGIVKGFSGGTQHLTLLNGYDGDYEVKMDATLTNVSNSGNFEVGISINDNDPLDGGYGGTYLDTTFVTQHVGVQSFISLSGGTTLSIDVRKLVGTDNVILEHAQIFARKVG
jgi:hypothetical protein